ncbi:MAG: hypothetical protein AAFO07_10120, partial [Bacteroidota bacterium]
MFIHKPYLLFKYVVITICLFHSIGHQTINAQTIEGKIIDSNKKPIQAVIIVGLDSMYRTKTTAMSEVNGNFVIDISGLSFFSFHHLNYQADTLSISAARSKNFTIQLTDKQFKFESVEIKANRIAYQNKNDTTRYDPKAFTDGHERSVEELIKKMPGVKVDDNGTIFFKGKRVEKVLLDEDDLFGSYYSIGTKNMPPSVIQKVEFIDKYLEEELYKGVADSDVLVMNLKVDPKAKVSIFGNIEAGGGTENRYLAKANVFHLYKKHKGLLFANTRNTITDNFSLSSLIHNPNGSEGIKNMLGVAPFYSTLINSPQNIPLSYLTNGTNNYLTSNQIFRIGGFNIKMYASYLNDKQNLSSFVNTTYNDSIANSFSNRSQADANNQLLAITTKIDYPINLSSKLKIVHQYKTLKGRNKLFSHIDFSNSVFNNEDFYEAQSRQNRLQVNYLNRISQKSVLALRYTGTFLPYEESIAALNEFSIDTFQLSILNDNQSFNHRLEGHNIEWRLNHRHKKTNYVLSLGYSNVYNNIVSTLSQPASNLLGDFHNQQRFRRKGHHYFGMIGNTSKWGKFTWKNAIIGIHSIFNEDLNEQNRMNSPFYHQLASHLEADIDNNFKLVYSIAHNRSPIPSYLASDLNLIQSSRSILSTADTFLVFSSFNQVLSYKLSKPKNLMEIYGSFSMGWNETIQANPILTGFIEETVLSGIARRKHKDLSITMDKYISKLKGNLRLSYALNAFNFGASFANFQDFRLNTSSFQLNWGSRLSELLAF